MIPGLTTRLSETIVASTTTIEQKADLLTVTGTTDIATIRPSFEGFSGICVIVPTTGTVNTVTTGNIPVAVAMAVNRATVFVYSKRTGKFYPGAIS